MLSLRWYRDNEQELLACFSRLRKLLHHLYFQHTMYLKIILCKAPLIVHFVKEAHPLISTRLPKGIRSASARAAIDQSCEMLMRENETLIEQYRAREDAGQGEHQGWL